MNYKRSINTVGELNLDDVPDEIIVSILCQSTCQTIIRLSQCNTRLNKISSDPHVKKHFYDSIGYRICINSELSISIGSMFIRKSSYENIKIPYKCTYIIFNLLDENTQAIVRRVKFIQNDQAFCSLKYQEKIVHECTKIDCNGLCKNWRFPSNNNATRPMLIETVL